MGEHAHDRLATRPLGRNGIMTTRIAFGTAPLATIFWGNDEATAIDAVIAGIDAGINLFDTAPLYGLGEAESRLGAALAARPDVEVMLTTKVGRTIVTGPDGSRDVEYDFAPDAIRRQLDESLGRLGRDHVDIVHIHDPEDHLDDATGHCFETLAALRSEGVVRAISVGTNVVDTARTFIERTDVDIVMVAGRLTLLDRRAEPELLPLCSERGIPLLAAGVFNSGVLARPTDDAWFDYAPASPEIRARVAALRHVCTAAGIPLRAAALQFPLRFPEVGAVVVGMAAATEVVDDLEALAVPIGDDVWAALDELA